MKLFPQSILFLSAMILASLFSISCDTLKTLDNIGNSEYFNPSSVETTPDYVISIHRIVKYPRAEDLEKEIVTLTGSKIVVNVNSEIHSRNFSKIEMIPRAGAPDTFDLKITLDRRGKMLWGNLSIAFRGDNLAFVIDGIMYRQFKARILGEDAESIMVEGPFDLNTASNVTKNSEKNYKIFNPQ